MSEYEKVEKPAIEQLQALGYDYVHGEELAPDAPAQERVGVSYRTVKVKDLKSLWSSCTKIGNIHFNWRIVMSPISIVDYVIVHELCHREIYNHSPDFWRLLGRILPDYRERKEWLRVNGALLTL